MDYNEILKNARECSGPYCKACPVCNGMACRTQVPGPGGKGTAATMLRNYQKWQEVCINMDTICENAPIDTTFTLFGRKFAAPIFAAPVGAMKLHYGDKYDDLTYKALAGANTQAVYYEATYPNGTLYLYPIASGCTLKIRVLNSVKQFASTSVNIDMPEGYEDAIMLALAIRMAPSYGKQVNPDTKQAARRAMNAIKVTNQVIPTMDLPDAVMGRSGSSFASFMSGG